MFDPKRYEQMMAEQTQELLLEILLGCLLDENLPRSLRKSLLERFRPWLVATSLPTAAAAAAAAAENQPEPPPRPVVSSNDLTEEELEKQLYDTR